MDKKTYNKITKEVFKEYGFKKFNNKYVLTLDDVTLVVYSCSGRGIRSFDYHFYINALHQEPVIDLTFTSDTLLIEHAQHSPSKKGYYSYEIVFEEYSEEEYKKILNDMFHVTFDVYKENALKYLKDNGHNMCLTKKAKEFLGII